VFRIIDPLLGILRILLLMIVGWNGYMMGVSSDEGWEVPISDRNVN